MSTDTSVSKAPPPLPPPPPPPRPPPPPPRPVARGPLSNHIVPRTAIIFLTSTFHFTLALLLWRFYSGAFTLTLLLWRFYFGAFTLALLLWRFYSGAFTLALRVSTPQMRIQVGPKPALDGPVKQVRPRPRRPLIVKNGAVHETQPVPLPRSTRREIQRHIHPSRRVDKHQLVQPLVGHGAPLPVLQDLGSRGAGRPVILEPAARQVAPEVHWPIGLGGPRRWASHHVERHATATTNVRPSGAAAGIVPHALMRRPLCRLACDFLALGRRGGLPGVWNHVAGPEPPIQGQGIIPLPLDFNSKPAGQFL